MKAIRKSDGKVIEVDSTPYFNMKTDEEYRRGLFDGKHYKLSDLDFNVDEEVTIDGWVARDKDGDIYVYKGKPTKEENYWLDDDAASIILLPITSFPTVTWESDPLEVTITIKPKKQ